MQLMQLSIFKEIIVFYTYYVSIYMIQTSIDADKKVLIKFELMQEEC